MRLSIDIYVLCRFFAERHHAFPPVTARSRHEVAKLALGDSVQHLSFYQPLQQCALDTQGDAEADSIMFAHQVCMTLFKCFGACSGRIANN